MLVGVPRTTPSDVTRRIPRDQVRTRVLGAAAQVFAERGFAGATTEGRHHRYGITKQVELHANPVEIAL